MKISLFCKKTVNYFIKHLMITKLSNENKIVYLTFDDGPDTGITEFVIDQLELYGFTATFFCKGENAEKYPYLLQRILVSGNSIANHTYSHMHPFNYNCNQYVNDVEKARLFLDTNIFRPPHGSLTFKTWLKLRKKYRIFYWSINSGDSDLGNYDFERSMKNLTKTKSGDVILFHFCNKHANETRELLPKFLQWLALHGYTSKAIKF